MSDQPNRITILNQRIFAGDPFIDRHKNFLFPQQLEQMAKLHSLPLNQLPNGHRRSDLAGKVAFPIDGLELSGHDNGHHPDGTPYTMNGLVR
jgi:hypothetical protein